MSPEIGDELRTTLAGLADVIIPPGDEMPSGGEVLIERGQLDAVLGMRPDLAEGLRLLLERARGAEPATEVDRLRAEDDAAFQLLATVVAGGYFLDEGVREALGYPGQEAIPIVHSDPPDYERDGLLAAVVERGPIYRPTPPAE
jgi:hypothetical protein